MLDIEFIRKNPDVVKATVKNKDSKVDINKVLELDAKRREAVTRLNTLQSERNKASEEVAKLKKAGQKADDIISRMKSVGNDIKHLETELTAVEAELSTLLPWIPNVPAADVPVGMGAESNLEIRRWGKRKEFSFTPKPHWEIGEKLGILAQDKATKMSGSGFILFMGMGARLERALINFMIDLHTAKHGYQEVSPPFMVNRASMFATGQLPKLEQDMYAIKSRYDGMALREHNPDDNMFLIPTAEVPLTNIWRDNIIDADKLPVYYVAYTPCFRREAGSYGKETRGITRVHQFDKVEMVKYVHPDTSFDELEKLVVNAEEVLQALGLEYRVIKLSTGEMSFSAAKTYDIEAWAPGMNQYLEVSSCGNFTDFQARRANIKFRDKDGKLRFVHTLNGSGVALPRTVICLLETFQKPDGTIEIPEALKPYME
ncbi:MAG: serine--tRNA ligase [Planctomycetota bacterium]